MSRTGADELRLDPMGLYQTDNFLLTKPRTEWTRSLARIPGGICAKKLEAFKGIELRLHPADRHARLGDADRRARGARDQAVR